MGKTERHTPRKFCVEEEMWCSKYSSFTKCAHISCGECSTVVAEWGAGCFLAPSGYDEKFQNKKNWPQRLRFSVKLVVPLAPRRSKLAMPVSMTGSKRSRSTAASKSCRLRANSKFSNKGVGCTASPPACTFKASPTSEQAARLCKGLTKQIHPPAMSASIHYIMVWCNLFGYWIWSSFVHSDKQLALPIFPLVDA
eukprot:3257775-Amphidinium_carterae.1